MTAARRTLVAGLGGSAALLMTVWTLIAAADEATLASPPIQKPVVSIQVAQARKSEIKDWNNIVRALAPGYQEAYGKPRLIELDIRFAFDKEILLPTAIHQLDHLARALLSEELEGSSFLIAGHTDAKGDAAYNKALSTRRAAAVRNFLAKERGIDRNRFDIVGWGEEHLKNPLDPDGAANRRVEVSLILPPRKGGGSSSTREASEPCKIDWTPRGGNPPVKGKKSGAGGSEKMKW